MSLSAYEDLGEYQLQTLNLINLGGVAYLPVYLTKTVSSSERLLLSNLLNKIYI